MKKVTMLLVALGGLTLSLADDASVDAQIEAMQSAPARERVELMNEFKRKLSLMNQEDRSEAIGKLQVKTQSKTRTRERVVEIRMNDAQDMARTRNMNQRQESSQFGQGAGSTSGGAKQGMGGH